MKAQSAQSLSKRRADSARAPGDQGPYVSKKVLFMTFSRVQATLAGRASPSCSSVVSSYMGRHQRDLDRVVPNMEHSRRHLAHTSSFEWSDLKVFLALFARQPDGRC